MKTKLRQLRKRLVAHWHRIGPFRKGLELLIAGLLLLSTVPSNAVRAAILLDGHPQLARRVTVTKAPASETRYVLGRFHIGRIYEIDHSYLDSSASFEVVDFHVTRILIFNVAYPTPVPG